MMTRQATAVLCGLLISVSAQAADQTQLGAGNARAEQIGTASPLVQTAFDYLVTAAQAIDKGLRPQGDSDSSQDVILAAPMWHGWAKRMVFQWNADGTEFTELNFGGTGTNDNNGGAGGSRTGGHHIMSIAETMARGLPP